MSRKKRGFTPFSLAFLDIMSCGFGAAVLLFLIIKHQADETHSAEGPDNSAEVALLEQDIASEGKAIADLTTAIREIEQELAQQKGQAARLREEVAQTSADSATLSIEDQDQRISALQAQLKQLSEKKEKVLTELEGQGKAVRNFVGDGQREYLTGLRINGRRIVILFDTSASMLDRSIVNIIRKRNMTPTEQKASDKWQRALATLDWLTARLPASAEFQVYFFDTRASVALTGTSGTWLSVGDGKQLSEVVSRAREIVPNGGTSLHHAFDVIAKMNPRPDNVYLITDGLPTQGGGAPRGTTVSGNRRLDHFDRAVRKIPNGVPINTILFPLEGDPMAAPRFWQLAQRTNGAFLSPARDWP